MKTDNVLEYLKGKVYSCKKSTLVTDLGISTSSASYHLGKLRKQKRVGLYLNKYWGLV